MASKRHVRRKECSRKVAYETEHEAAAAKQKLISKHSGRMIVYYHCKWCGKWHVGHAPKNVRNMVHKIISESGEMAATSDLGSHG